MTELKKCPFCGGEAELKRGLTYLDNFVKCKACGCSTKLFNTIKSAIKAWNTRKPVDNVVEALEREKSDWNDDYNVPIKKAIKIVKEKLNE